MERIALRTILMDVDGTMTIEKKSSGVADIKSPWQILVDLYREKNNLTTSEAEKVISSCGDCNLCCLSGFLPALGIAEEVFFENICVELAKKITIPTDTINFFKAMKAKGIQICSATTNSRFMTLAKLSLGKIASCRGCEYLTRFHSGNEFGDPKGKFSENFFPNILSNHHYDPELTMMIGDEPDRDLYPALRAGIKYGVILNRQQNCAICERNGGLFIRSLSELENYLKRSN